MSVHEMAGLRFRVIIDVADHLFRSAHIGGSQVLVNFLALNRFHQSHEGV